MTNLFVDHMLVVFLFYGLAFFLLGTTVLLQYRKGSEFAMSPILPFLACIGLGRGKRVWLLALLIRLFGERAEQILHKYVEWIGWAALILLAGPLAWWVWLR